MSPQTDLIDSAAGAFSNPRRSSPGTRSPFVFGSANRPRRGVDRGVLWVRITLVVVVSALIFWVVASKAKSTWKLAPSRQAQPAYPDDP